MLKLIKLKMRPKLLKTLNAEVDALIEARQLTVDQVENVGRVLFQQDVTTVSQLLN